MGGNSPGVERNLCQNVTNNEDNILNKENPSPVPDMDDLDNSDGLGKENSTCNAEKVKPKKRKRRKRSEKQKERFRQYLTRRQIMQERLLNESRVFVYQYPGYASAPVVYIPESEATPAIPQTSSAEELPSPALGLLSPKNDISLRDYKNSFESALVIQYEKRVSDILSQGDAHASSCPKQAVSVLSLNPFAKPFVPAALRKTEPVLEVQSALGSPVMSVDYAILDANQFPETDSTLKSSAEPAVTQERESLLPASGDICVPSCEISSDVLAAEVERCSGSSSDVEHAEIIPYNIADDDDACGISDAYDESCLLSDILSLFIALFIILTVVSSFQ